MHQEMEALRGKDDKAIIETFKNFSEFEELQLDFAHPAFETVKLHVYRVVGRPLTH